MIDPATGDWSSNYPASQTEKLERLHQAAAFIAKIPKGKFRMRHWWLKDGRAFDDDRNVMYRVTRGACGCAAGHLAQQGLFNLTPDNLWKGVRNRKEVFSTLGDTFGIGSNLAQFIFDNYSYRWEATPAQVAARIRFVISEIEAEPA